MYIINCISLAAVIASYTMKQQHGLFTELYIKGSSQSITGSMTVNDMFGLWFRSGQNRR